MAGSACHHYPRARHSLSHRRLHAAAQITKGPLAPGAIEVNPYWATYNRSWVVARGRLPLDAKLGACWDGASRGG